MENKNTNMVDNESTINSTENKNQESLPLDTDFLAPSIEITNQEVLEKEDDKIVTPENQETLFSEIKNEEENNVEIKNESTNEKTETIIEEEKIVEEIIGKNYSKEEEKGEISQNLTIKSKDVSVVLFIFCLILPIFAPFVALFRGKFMLFFGIMALYLIGLILLMIPILGLLICIAIDVYVAYKVSLKEKVSNIEVKTSFSK